MAEFDKKAATWDDDPARVDRAEVIADSLAEALDLSKIKTAMEYGSGTGLLSFALRNRLSNIVLIDESSQMIEMVKKKCVTMNVTNFTPLEYNLLKQPMPENKFDLIYILLTLHHIEDTGDLLNKFYQLLNPGGYLAIIDLEKEDGSFHEHNTHFHNGFDRDYIESKLIESKLVPTRYEVCYELERDYDKEKQKYPLFLLLSQKKS